MGVQWDSIQAYHTKAMLSCPVHSYSEVRPPHFTGVCFQVIVCRTAALGLLFRVPNWTHCDFHPKKIRSGSSCTKGSESYIFLTQWKALLSNNYLSSHCFSAGWRAARIHNGEEERSVAKGRAKQLFIVCKQNYDASNLLEISLNFHFNLIQPW